MSHTQSAQGIRWTVPNVLTILRVLMALAMPLIMVGIERPLADWLVFALFTLAALTDFVDGWLARAWDQGTAFGKMLDPIADKLLVVLALALVIGLSELNALILIPASVVLFREIFVSGLREFLGENSSQLSVTKLAKWKTTAQMVAIAALLLAFGFDYQHLLIYGQVEPGIYATALEGGEDPMGILGIVQSAYWLSIVGTVLLWLAAVLTLITGFDYFWKALPYLGEND